MRLLSFLLLACLAIRVPAAAPRTVQVFLSGTDGRSPVDWEFMTSAGAKAGTWSTLPVPSNWELHGFGTYSFGSVTPSETGHYRHRFATPAIPAGQRVFLVFDGVMTDTTARLNGQSVGPVHQGGFYRFKYEVGALLKPAGDNLLEVDVDETSANAGVNRAERTGDYWNFGGIYRPVSLEIVPETFIERIAVDARADGALTVQAFVNGPAGGKVVARVTELSGRPVGRAQEAAVDGELTALQWAIPGVKPWTAETPHLYAVQVDLLNASGEVVHRVTDRLGFRTFEVRAGDGLYLNGRKIVLQGVNRHSFHPDTGRSLGEADHRTDIALMKEMNLNAVRMSHYPPDARFLELCDELGLYVLDELAGWQKSYDTGVGRQLAREMLVRDVNHPSILFWDNGNEGGWNTELDVEFGRFDPQQRPVLHPWGITHGINTAHYKVYPQAEHLAKGYTTSWNYDPKEVPKMGEHPLIYMPTEFVHALYDGGGGAGLEDYWKMMRASPTLGGAFIWVFRDEGVMRDGAIDPKGNQAPDGLVGPRGEKEASFFTVKEVWSPLPVRGELPAQGSALRLTVENRYSFTDARQCTYTWQVRRLKDGDAKSAGRKAAFPPLAPGATANFEITLPKDWRSGDVLELRVADPAGAELWTYSWPLPGANRFRELSAQPANGAALAAIEESPAHLDLKVGGTTARIARDTGLLVELRQDGAIVPLANGPRPLAGAATLRSLAAVQDGKAAVVRATFDGALEQVEWRLQPGGWLDCTFTYRPAEKSSAQGVGFDLPNDTVRAKRWIGQGPYRVWRNRLRGVRFGEWSNAYNDTVTGWSGWDYPEFKGYFADVRWLELQLAGGTLEVATHSPGQYVQVLTPTQPPENLRMSTKLDLPVAGLAFLDTIPPIGSKFTKAELMGPQGAPSPLAASYRHTISLRVRP